MTGLVSDHTYFYMYVLLVVALLTVLHVVRQDCIDCSCVVQHRGRASRYADSLASC